MHKLAQDGGYNLPRYAELILEPAARFFIRDSGKLRPEVIHFCLVRALKMLGSQGAAFTRIRFATGPALHFPDCVGLKRQPNPNRISS